MGLQRSKSAGSRLRHLLLTLCAGLLPVSFPGLAMAFAHRHESPRNLQGIWIAGDKSPLLYRLRIDGDSIVIFQSPVAQPVHGYIALGHVGLVATIDMVLEHLGTSRGIYRQLGSDLDLSLNTKFDDKARPEAFGRAGFATLHLHRYRPIQEMAEESAKQAAGAVTLLAPSGPFRVGRRYLHLTDSSRDDPNFDDLHQHYRELAVHLWYPALAGGTRAAYYPYLPQVRKAIGENGLRDEMEDAYPVIGRTCSHTLVGAPPALTLGGSPLVIFMPGQGFNSTHYTALIEDLVSHGYVVAGIEDTYYADAVAFEKGRTETFAAARWQKPSNYAETVAFDQEISDMLAADILFVLDQLRTSSSSRIDFNRVGLMGHSVGGRGAARAAQLDRRFKACVDLDGFSPGGTPFSNFGGVEMRCPFMLLRARDRTPPINEMQSVNMTLRGYRDWLKRAADQRDAFYSRTGSTAVEVSLGVPGYNHASFTDLPLLSPGSNAQRRDRTLAMRMTRSYVRAFFDQELLGKKESLRVAERDDGTGSVVKSFKAHWH